MTKRILAVAGLALAATRTGIASPARAATPTATLQASHAGSRLGADVRTTPHDDDTDGGDSDDGGDDSSD